jgi:N-hydroxyarylamine O-acetyltransferase
MDLDAYFARTGYAGPREPTLAVLQAVVFAHACTIPFENLNVLLGRGISLDGDAVEQKLVRDRRGGYCFEQNSLLMQVLTALGFAVTPLSARVRVNQPPGVIPPRTHLFLRVDLDGVPWLADVGVGSFSPTNPIRLDSLDEEQAIPHEPRRVVCESRTPLPRYIHQAKSGDTWVDVYEFSGEEMPAVDRELANWWTSTHPESRFRHNLIASLAGPNGIRLSILNREFTRRRGADVLERFEIADADHLLGVLDDRFGLTLPPGTRFGEGEKPWPTR